ncbi:unnamed protein product [Gongylonema pulchrum]|uniref:Secreted protein n=1 Tax=Gongylonema pulchrum TaxID=637853 RepID=A0A183E1Q9_9BILA|nr:unnamed protein product [Gongylonema pulchrum]
MLLQVLLYEDALTPSRSWGAASPLLFYAKPSYTAPHVQCMCSASSKMVAGKGSNAPAKGTFLSVSSPNFSIFV